ncbi:MAG: hypothetical protein IT581_06355 [Verrucomicrobiales bacterium]|nr:hypothetical protein [Verrucomicrobiales bacterium]
MNLYSRWPVLVACLAGLLSPQALAQWLTQEVPLRAGWNAVYLHIQPHPASCDLQLAGTPVTEVHRYNQRLRVAQFDLDPAKPFRRPDEWLSWRPDNETNRYVRTLEVFAGDLTYLIQATHPVTLRFQGRPMIPRREWVPGIPNLVGFQINPASGERPTFAAFFSGQAAIPVVGGPEEGRIQDLDPNLNGIDLTSRSRRQTMEPGKAYWVLPSAHSRFVGPLEVRTANLQGLFFDASLHELPMHLKNASAAPLSVTLQHVASDAPPPGESPRVSAVPLLWSELYTRPPSRRPWSVGEVQTRVLAPGEEWSLRLAVDRAAMSPPADRTATWQSLIRIQGAGMQIHVPVGARHESTIGERLATPTPNPQAGGYPSGLWVGEALVNLVGYLGATDAEGATNVTTPAGGSPFPMRLIVHQDGAGVCRLLPQVLVMGKTVETSTATNVVISLQAGSGSDLPNRFSVVLSRISSPALGALSGLPLTNVGGSFLQSPVQWTFAVPADAPLNPYRHLYHPQHTHGIALTHHIELHWDPSVSATNPPAALWTPDETVSGLLVQSVEGLTQVPIKMQGRFVLKRVSSVASLEDSP